MGVWTVMPNFAHTHFCEQRNLEFDPFVGFDFYGHNAATNYSCGIMFIGTAWTLPRRGLGSVRSDPTSRRLPTTEDGAEVLNGLAGRAEGVDPIVLYVAKREKPGMSFQLRWINEFRVTNMLKGNTVMDGRHSEAEMTLALWRIYEVAGFARKE